MKKIEQDIINHDAHIKKKSNKLRSTLKETVDLDGLSSKIMSKFLIFLQQKVSDFKPKECPTCSEHAAISANTSVINQDLNISASRVQRESDATPSRMASVSDMQPQSIRLQSQNSSGGNRQQQ